MNFSLIPSKNTNKKSIGKQCWKYYLLKIKTHQGDCRYNILILHELL